MQGLLLIDKPSGITSFGVVAKIKKLCGTKRVGHTGTLDPMATGVLPILVGRSTVLSDYLLSADKEYIAKVKLGISTDTLDITGKILKSEEVSFEKEQLQKVISSFLGTISQVPPMFSAIKKDGVRLYDLARKGEVTDRKARQVEIKEIELLASDSNSFEIRVLCSKGTYIRTLAEDIGKALNTGAVLTELRRTKTAGIDIKNCIELNSLNEENIFKCLKNEEILVSHFERVVVSEKQAIRFQNGGELELSRLKGLKNISDNKIYRVVFGDTLIGLGAINLKENSLKIKCLTRHFSDNC